MEVKLKTGLLEMQTFAVKVEPETLVFQSEQNTIHIPLAELMRIYIAGPAEAENRFTIETANREYEGQFLNPGEGNTLLEQLRERIGYQPEIERKQNEEEQA